MGTVIDGTARRELGRGGPRVAPIALGCAGMSGEYGTSDDAESIATVVEAIDQGINLIDTADFYGMGHNESLIAKAIAGRRDQTILSLKFGGLRDPRGMFVGIDGRPASVKNYLAYSLRRLGVDHVDIYRPARLDPQVPIEDTIGAIAELVQAGYVRHIGLSEVGPDTIRRAHAVHPIRDVQIEYSLMSRGPETHIFPLLRELGIAVTAYGVLGHGLLSGKAKPADPGQSHIRAHLPRFQGENFARNRTLAEALGRVAAEKGVSGSQLAIAWALAQGSDIVPVMGARTRAHLRETIEALDIMLTAEDLAAIERAVPADAVAGTRYATPLMAMLDSEKAA